MSGIGIKWEPEFNDLVFWAGLRALPLGGSGCTGHLVVKKNPLSCLSVWVSGVHVVFLSVYFWKCAKSLNEFRNPAGIFSTFFFFWSIQRHEDPKEWSLTTSENLSWHDQTETAVWSVLVFHWVEPHYNFVSYHSSHQQVSCGYLLHQHKHKTDKISEQDVLYYLVFSCDFNLIIFLNPYFHLYLSIRPSLLLSLPSG